MNKNKQIWLKTFIILVISFGLVFLVSQLIIFSRPKPLHFYLEFLDRASQRGQNVSVYSRADFAKKYLGASGDAYAANDFFKLFQEHFNNPPAKENNLFRIYKVTSKDDPCQINIFGINKRKDLVYVSAENICLKNEQKIK